MTSLTSVNNGIFNLFDLGAKEYTWVPMGGWLKSGLYVRDAHQQILYMDEPLLPNSSRVNRSDWDSESSYLDKFRVDVD